MFAEGIFPIGDGLLDIDEERLKALLVPHDINEIYEIEQTPFARGKFAAVRRAIHKNSGTHFAAKFLKRRRRAQSSDREIKHEIAVLMLCNDAENIVKLNAVHESRSDTALLLELATGGELQTFLDNEECLTEAQARICMREVLKALQYLHKRSIVHLDLKPQNILLTGEHIEDGLKLCDFGISRVVAEGTNVREIVGTPDYVAPEVLQYEPLSLCTDIWSVGVLAYVLLSGFSPFGGETKQETFLNISQCALTFPDKLFGGVSSAAIDFIRKSLRIKPNDRMTAAGCLEHIWLKDECNIDRHIFNAINSKQQLEQDDDDDDQHDDEDDDDREVDDDEDHEQEDEEEHHDNAVDEVQIVNDKPQAISVDNSEEEDNTSNNSFAKTTHNPLNKTTNSHTNGHVNGHSSVHTNGHTNGFANGHTNGFAKGHSNGLTNGHTNGFLNDHSNGHIAVLSKGHSVSSFTKLRDDLHDKTIKLASVKQPVMCNSNATTTKTTAVHNVPATKAITIPLCSVQPTSSLHQQLQQTSPQEQQLLHIPARRHSSESNKENTFLTTKKISANNCNGSTAILKKTSSASSTVTQSATATIHITPAATLNASNIVATITLPTSNAAVNVTNDKVSVNNSNHHSLFPDAPTTPKVIRKAPTTDASPTSVKALVKKFQLEGGEQPITPPEFATNGSKIHHHPQLQQQQQQAQQQHNQSQLKYNAQGSSSRPSLSPPTLAHSSAITIANSSRRASEPITAIHTTKKLSTTSSSAPVSMPASAAAHNYKTTCVYCVSCTNSSTNGCRHPNSSTSNISTSLAATAVAANTPLSSNSTKSLINGSTSNGSLTSTTSSNAAASTSSPTTALLFGQHQHSHSQHLLNSHQHQQQHSHHSHHHPHHHHHHHHLHHHGVVKSAAASANGLSLDQGIIC
ncbi:death-associated protein kinase related [Calliphora vicina]|uniref:death-associated protein kinase related n=1 Tax=Calliphora vicina TaxID=7373 RepID=UPI00325A709A